MKAPLPRVDRQLGAVEQHPGVGGSTVPATATLRTVEERAFGGRGEHDAPGPTPARRSIITTCSAVAPAASVQTTVSGFSPTSGRGTSPATKVPSARVAA